MDLKSISEQDLAVLRYARTFPIKVGSEFRGGHVIAGRTVMADQLEAAAKRLAKAGLMAARPGKTDIYDVTDDGRSVARGRDDLTIDEARGLHARVLREVWGGHRTADNQRRFRAAGTVLARAVLDRLGVRLGNTAWELVPFAGPEGQLGFVNIATGSAGVSNAELPPHVIEALTIPDQPGGPRASGAAFRTFPDPGEPHHAEAPESWVQLLCDIRPGADIDSPPSFQNLPLPDPLDVRIVWWGLRTCYGGRRGNPGPHRLVGLHSRAGLPPEKWPQLPTSQTMAETAADGLRTIALAIAARVGLADEIAEAFDTWGPGGVVPLVQRSITSAAGSATSATDPFVGHDVRVPSDDVRWLWSLTPDGAAWRDLLERLTRLWIVTHRVAPAARGLAAHMAGVEGREARPPRALLKALVQPAVTELWDDIRAGAIAADTADTAIAAYLADGPVNVDVEVRRFVPSPSDEPVGLAGIAERLGVQRGTVDQWRQRGVLPKEDGDGPSWRWSTIHEWADSTGRLP